MVAVFIGIGSNIEPQKNISNALALLPSMFPSIVFSRIFESEAIGFKGDNFLNLVARFDSIDIDSIDIDSNDFDANDLDSKYTGGGSNSDPIETLTLLVKKLKVIENRLGRKQGDKKFSARSIDIDVLLFGDLQTKSPNQLPRSEILENAYVLWPLAELAPDLKHPGSDKSYAEYWNEFDKSLQKLVPIDEIVGR